MNTSTPKDEQLSFLLDEKQCPKCNKVLPIKEFYFDKQSKDGLFYYCKSCDSDRRKKWRKNNPERQAISNKYFELKKRARKKNIPMEINAEYIKNMYPDDMICPVLGIKMERGIGGSPENISNSSSIDRIIPEKGYVPGNVIVVSMKANQIKSNATPDEIIKVGKFYKKLLEEMEDGSKAD